MTTWTDSRTRAPVRTRTAEWQGAGRRPCRKSSRPAWSRTTRSRRRTACQVPPPPRLCGARFSHDGRLVCFFPTKEEKAKALFTSPEGIKERAKGEPFFPGFGRMIPESPIRNKYSQDDTSATDDQSDSDESGRSSTSSTDSESTSMHKSSLWYHPGRSLGRTWSGNRSVRSSGGGTGVGTGTGTGASKKRAAKPRNVVSIHDIRNDLPSKKEFAQEYLIFGDGARCAATTHGLRRSTAGQTWLISGTMPVSC